MNDLVKTVLVALMSAALSVLITAYWFRKNRVVKQEDDEDSESKQERKALASDIEKTRQVRADKLEGIAEATLARLAGHDAEIATLKAHAAPINAAFAAILVKELTHFHTPVMDALMAKLDLDAAVPAPTLSDDEEKELIAALEQRAEDMGPEISENERDAAKMLSVMMRRVKREAAKVANGATFNAVKVVGIISEGE